MPCCCNENGAHLQHVRGSQTRMLSAVLVINSAMRAAKFSAGWRHPAC